MRVFLSWSGIISRSLAVALAGNLAQRFRVMAKGQGEELASSPPVSTLSVTTDVARN